MLIHNVVEAAVESEFMRFDPIKFMTFFGGEMKLNELIFRNWKLNGFFDLLANKIVFELHKGEKTNELVAQKGDKTK